MPQKTKPRLYAPAFFSLFFAAAPAAAGELRVKIDGLAGDGAVYAGLHNAQNAGHFPENPNAGQVRIEPGGAAAVTAVFKDLAPGQYAVSAFQDEDGDGSLNKNIFGVPAERYGFSNGAAGVFGPPDFSSAAFTAGGGAHNETVTLTGAGE